MALIIPNEDLEALPAIVTPVPPELLDELWSFEITPAHASADLPNSFGIVSIFAVAAEHLLALQDTGGDAYRLDLYAGGGSSSVGVLEWSGTPTMRVTVDVPGSTISIEVLAGAVTFGGGWDSSDATSATKTLAPWTWNDGAELNVGGFFDLFVFEGTIENVSDDAGAGPVYGDMEGTAAGEATVSGALTALAALSGSASGETSVTGTPTASANLSGASEGTASVEGALSALASISGTAAGTSSVSGRLTDASALDAPVTEERTYVIAPEDRIYVIPPEDRTYTITRAA